MSAPAAKALSPAPVSYGATLRIVGLVRGEGIDQVGQHAGIERVERIGAIEGDERNGAALLHENVLIVCHAATDRTGAA